MSKTIGYCCLIICFTIIICFGISKPNPPKRDSYNLIFVVTDAQIVDGKLELTKEPIFYYDPGENR